MLSEERFKKVIREYITWVNRTGQVEDFLGINLMETDWCGYAASLFDDYIISHFNETGVDLILQYFFEEQSLENIQDNNITVDVEELWDRVKDYRI